MIKILVLLFISIISTILYFTIDNEVNVILISCILLANITSIIILLKLKDNNIKLRNNYLKHIYLFIFGYVIVHFYYYTCIIFDNSIILDNTIWYKNTLINKCILLSTIGLSMLILGYIVKSRIKVKTKRSITVSLNDKHLVKIAFFVVCVYLLFINPSYVNGNYGSQVDRGPISEYLGTLFEAIVIVILSIKNINYKINEVKITSFIKYITSNGILFNTSILLYLFPVLLSGERNPLIFVGLSYIGAAIFIVEKKLNIKFLIAFVTIGMFTATLLSNVRSMDKSLSFEEKVLLSMNKDNNRYQDNASELASSIKTLHIALDYVPSNKSYFGGQLQFQTILVSVPGLFGIYSKVFSIEKKYQTSSQFITWIEQGDYPLWGEGTTCIADFYLDLGLIGVVLGMFSFGYVIRICEEKISSDKISSYFIYILSISIYSLSIYVARSSIMYSIRLGIFAYLIFFIYLNLYKYIILRK